MTPGRTAGAITRGHHTQRRRVPSMVGPSTKEAEEQEQNITAAPLASAGERGKSLISEEHYAVTGEVRRHGGDQRHGGEGQDDHGGDAPHIAGDVVVTTADGTG